MKKPIEIGTHGAASLDLDADTPAPALKFTPDNDTQADYWIREQGGKWRKARTDKQCDAWNLEQRGKRCQLDIKAGDHYLDTGEGNLDALSPWQTLRFCSHCAMLTHADSEAARARYETSDESLREIRDSLASLPPDDEASH